MPNDIPADTAKVVVAQIKDKGHVTRGWMGVQVQGVTADIANSLGMKLVRISPGKFTMGSPRSQDARSEAEHPHGLSDHDYDALFTVDKPVIFAYHGYPWLIHRLTYRRAGEMNLHVRGYKEEGTVTTPFDMVVRNDMDRFHLVMDVIDRVPGLAIRAAHVRQLMVDERTRHGLYTREFGEDLPEVRDWKWTNRA